jgi:hypothetical protein
VITKYFFAFGDNQLNAPVISCFRNIGFDFLFFLLFLRELYLGFDVTWLEITMGFIGGLLFSNFSYIVTYIDSVSKVGLSDALIET